MGELGQIPPAWIFTLSVERKMIPSVLRDFVLNVQESRSLGGSKKRVWLSGLKKKQNVVLGAFSKLVCSKEGILRLNIRTNSWGPKGK